MSSSTQVNIAPLGISISPISVLSTGPDPDSVLKRGEAFNLTVTVTFSGAGALAIVPLGIPVKVEFFAESIGSGSELSLGSATVGTAPGVFVYPVTLSVAAATSSLLTAERVYKIAAVLRVGATAFPAIANGFSEELAIEVYNP
ncbi:MAG: hypothetical protein LVS60_10445 [Nodosilinea sp. LVE1205-7]|jgi:hypothetical protein